MYARPASPDDAALISEFNFGLVLESEGRRLD